MRLDLDTRGGLALMGPGTEFKTVHDIRLAPFGLRGLLSTKD